MTDVNKIQNNGIYGTSVHDSETEQQVEEYPQPMGVVVVGVLDSERELPTNGKTVWGNPVVHGSAYLIDKDMHVWFEDEQQWINVGQWEVLTEEEVRQELNNAQYTTNSPNNKPPSAPYSGATRPTENTVQKVRELEEQLDNAHINSLINDVEDEIKAGVDLGGDPLVPLTLLKKHVAKIQNAGLFGRKGNEMTQNPVDNEYNRVANDILTYGVPKGDRTGTGTLSTFGQMMEFDISNGKIPMLTTKKVHLRSIIHELLWMLSGDTNIRYLKANNVNIWDSWIDPETAEYYYLTDDEVMQELTQRCSTTNITFEEPVEGKRWTERRDDGSVIYRVASEDKPREAYRKGTGEEPQRLIAGDLPNVYGKQWRCWESIKEVKQDQEEKYKALGYGVVGIGGDLTETTYGEKTYFMKREVDQIANIVDQLKNNPDSRRIILCPWNVGEIDQMALPPCHLYFQLWTRELSNEERRELMGDKLMSEDARQYDLTAESLYDRLGDNELTEKDMEQRLKQWLDEAGLPKRELSSLLLLRSNDTPLGKPFNMVQYALLTHMLARITNMITGTFKYVAGDDHIYQNQVDILKEQIQNEPFADTARISLNPAKTDIDDFVFEDFTLHDYDSHGVVTYPAAAV